MKSTDSSNLAEMVDRILDKGIVIAAWSQVSLVAVELFTIEGEAPARLDHDRVRDGPAVAIKKLAPER